MLGKFKRLQRRRPALDHKYVCPSLRFVLCSFRYQRIGNVQQKSLIACLLLFYRAEIICFRNKRDGISRTIKNSTYVTWRNCICLSLSLFLSPSPVPTTTTSAIAQFASIKHLQSMNQSMTLRLSFFLLLCCFSCSDWFRIAGVNADDTDLGGEMAFFTTPQMATGITHRQNVCDRYLAFRNGTMNIKNALAGLQLNVLMGAYNGSYFNYDDENGIDPTYPGIAAIIMDELAQRAGFTWRDSFGIFTDPKGADYNETWTDVLVWGVEHYDVNIDWWARNLERMNMGVAFTREWYDSSIIMIGKKDPDEFTDENLGFHDFWNWLRPFNGAVWWTTVATIVMSGLVFQLLEYLVDERKDRKFWVWFSENMYLVRTMV